MVAPLTVNILYNKGAHGLNEDVVVIERILKKLQDSIGQPIAKVKLLDMREPHVSCDVQFHLEIPVFSAVPWAHTNIILVNPEQWSYSYDDYVHAFDALIFREMNALNRFKDAYASKCLRTDNMFYVPWTTSWCVKDIKAGFSKNGDDGFVSFLGGSTNKYEYVKKIAEVWTEDDPSLTIYTTRSDFTESLQNIGLAKNITIKNTDLDLESRQRLSAFYRGHIVCSEGEGFGYSAANTEVVGAFTIMNSLPVFKEMFEDSPGTYFLSDEFTENPKKRYQNAKPSSNLRNELDSAFSKFKNTDFEEIKMKRQELNNSRFHKTCNEFLTILKKIQELVKSRKPTKGHWHCPPVLYPQECPPISIITPTFNRGKLIQIAFHNLLSTDYPHEMIEWVVIEDNEKKDRMMTEEIMSFQIQVPKIKLKYIPIEGKMTIGEKRNLGIEHSSNDIILFMDDDDHYPETSFRRRVAWLTKGTKCGKTGEVNIACCTTLALYDLKFGTSAVNVPPYDIPFGQRISEATLTFRKSAWLARKFPDVSISEGEEWINGRESEVIEIPPQQIIVAFSHGSNKSSRRIPPTENKPACFWGFPKEYLIFIHKLVGVDVEEDNSKSSKKK